LKLQCSISKIKKQKTFWRENIFSQSISRGKINRRFGPMKSSMLCDGQTVPADTARKTCFHSCSSLVCAHGQNPMGRL